MLVYTKDGMGLITAISCQADNKQKQITWHFSLPYLFALCLRGDGIPTLTCNVWS